MGLILLFVAIILVIGFWTYVGSRVEARTDSRTCVWSNTIVGLTIPTVVFTIATCITIGVSFDSYSTLKARYDATINQYRGAVTMYTDRADLNVKKAAFTDFVYKGYQENIAGFIRSLRKEVVIYNKKLIRKKVYVNNWFFGWVIVAPDKEMLIINMIEK